VGPFQPEILCDSTTTRQPRSPHALQSQHPAHCPALAQGPRHQGFFLRKNDEPQIIQVMWDSHREPLRQQLQHGFASQGLGGAQIDKEYEVSTRGEKAAEVPVREDSPAYLV